MRLPVRSWNNTLKSMGFRKRKRKPQTKRPTFQSSFESLEARQLMTVSTTVSANLSNPISALLASPPQLVMHPAPDGHIPTPTSVNADTPTPAPSLPIDLRDPSQDSVLQQGLSIVTTSQSRGTTLSSVDGATQSILDAATTIDLPTGDFDTSVSALASTSMGTGTLSAMGPSGMDLSPPSASSSTVVFQGQDDVNNTLSLNLDDLPRLADGSLAIGTVVYNGGAGGYDTLRVTGGNFTKEIYTPTGRDSGVIQYDDFSIVFTGLEPVESYGTAQYIEIDGTDDADQIIAVDGTPHNGQDTIKVYEANGNFENITFANKQGLLIEGLGGDDTIDISGISTTNSNLPLMNALGIVLDGGDGNDVLKGTAYDSTGQQALMGDGGNDTLYATGGGSYPDTLYGGDGDDTFVISGYETIHGSTGNDTVTVNLPAAAAVNMTETAVSFSGYTDNYDDIQTVNLIGSGGSYTIAPVTQYLSLPNTVSVNDSSMSALTVNLTGANDIVGTIGSNINLIGDVENTSVTYVSSPSASIVVDAGGGNDIFWALDNVQAETLRGGAGGDVFYVYGGTNTLAGGLDNDVYSFTDYYAVTNPLGHDTIIEDTGGGTYDEVDFYYLNEGVTVDLSQTSEQAVVPDHLWLTIQNSSDGQADIETSSGSYYDDTIIGNDLDNGLWGNSGNDTLIGGVGNDTLIAGDGNDIMYSDAGNDTLIGGYFTPTAANGNDTYVFDPSRGDGGNLGSDIILEDDNADKDTIDLSAFNSSQAAALDLSTVDWQTVNASILTLYISSSTAIENVMTGAGNDVVTGNSRDNLIDTDGGNDTIYGQDGNDNLFGGMGDDVIYAGAGDDILYGGYGNDQLYGEAGDDHLEGSAGDDALYGGDGNDYYDYAWSLGPGAYSLGLDQIYESSGSGTDDKFDFSNFNAADFTQPASFGTTIVSHFSVSDPIVDGETPVMRDLLTVNVNTASTIETVIAPPVPEIDPTFAGHVLIVKGPGVDGDITLTTDTDGIVHAWINNVDTPIEHSPVEIPYADDIYKIQITTGNDNDNIDLSSVTTALFPNLEQVSIDAGGGDDQITGANWSSSLVTGDANQDGVFDSADIPAMINALTDLPTWEAKHPSLTPGEARYILDVNKSCVVGNDDLSELIKDLINRTSIVDEIITGGVGDDVLMGGPGNDLLQGSEGNDKYVFDPTSDFGDRLGKHIVAEAPLADSDTIDLSLFDATQPFSLDLTNNTSAQNLAGVVSLLLTSDTGVENVLGGAGNDIITGNSRDNLIDGGAGADVISAGAGNDTIYAFDGNTDTIDGGTGVNSLMSRDSFDSVSGFTFMPPNAPSNIAATAISGSEIDLSWTNNAFDQSGFRIEMRQDGSDTWTTVGTASANATTFPVTGLNAGGKGYWFRVAATNSNGNSDYGYTFDVTRTQNQAPSVAISPSANPSPATGTDATLNVRGNDDGGESNLIYVWSLVSSPTDGDADIDGYNYSNAAKQSHVEFSSAGTYVFDVTITDALGMTTDAGEVSVTVQQTLTSIAISPSNIALRDGTSQQFTAVGIDQFDTPMATQPTFTWYPGTSIFNGSISATGLFTAFDNAQDTAAIQATADGVWGTANATLTPDRQTLIDFNDLPPGTVVTNQYADKGIIFSAPSGFYNVLDDEGWVGNYLLTDPPQPDPIRYGNPLTVTFTTPVNHLSFLAVGIDDNGSVGEVTVHSGSQLLGTYTITGEVVDLSAFANVTRIDISITDSYGLAWDDFTYDASNLLSLTVSDHSHPTTTFTALNDGQGYSPPFNNQLVISADSSTNLAIDVASLFDSVKSGQDIHLLIKRNDGYIVTDTDMSGGSTLDDVLLPVTDIAHDFAVSCFLDDNGNGQLDSGEADRTVKVDAVAVAPTINLEIDEDNNDGNNLPDGSDWEKSLKNNPYAFGKMIRVNSPRVPMVLTLAKNLDLNDQNVAIKFDWPVNTMAGNIKLWTSPNGVFEVEPSAAYSLSTLNYNANTGQIIVYVEGQSETEQAKTLAGIERFHAPNDSITATLTVNGKDQASDHVKFFVTSPTSFLYQLETRPEVRAALAANGVYNTNDDLRDFGLKVVPQGQLVAVGVPADIAPLFGNNSGVGDFKVQLYQDFTQGPGQFILAFRGTESLDDWIANFKQGIGIPTDYYDTAMTIGKALSRAQNFDGHLIITGHSLGGGLASAAAVVSGFKTYTFNAAGLNHDLLDDQNYPKSTDRYNAAWDFIQAYSVDIDVLTTFQRHFHIGLWSPPEAIGRPIEIPSVLFRISPGSDLLPTILTSLPGAGDAFAYVAHSMDSVLSGLLNSP
jgi:Ca2+-binding RTX toxin-like protein